MHIKKLLEIIDIALPAQSAADGDRIGLQIHAGGDNVSIVLVTYELNEDVIDEAVKLKCDCIISFHPLIYYPLQQIHLSERTGRLSIGLIRHSISLIVCHTNFDVYTNGTSAILAKKLGLVSEGFLEPSDKFGNCGMGVVAKPQKPMEPIDLINKVSELCCSPVRYCPGSGNQIGKVAIVGGSGSSFIDEAIDKGCDAFITADITYHKFHQAHGRIMLIDPGHYETEQFVATELAALIRSLDTENELETVTVSDRYTNPVCYYPDMHRYSEKQMNYLINNNLTV